MVDKARGVETSELPSLICLSRTCHILLSSTPWLWHLNLAFHLAYAEGLTLPCPHFTLHTWAFLLKTQANRVENLFAVLKVTSSPLSTWQKTSLLGRGGGARQPVRLSCLDLFIQLFNFLSWFSLFTFLCLDFVHPHIYLYAWIVQICLFCFPFSHLHCKSLCRRTAPLAVLLPPEQERPSPWTDLLNEMIKDA